MLINIEAERARHGLSKSQLSNLLGVTLKTYQNWITEKTDIPSSKIIQMAKLWFVTTDYLLSTRRDR